MVHGYFHYNFFMKQIRIIWIVVFIVGLGVRSTQLFHPVDRLEWRESDLASIARNYYRNGMDFFHPQIDWRGNGPGFTESEFPLYPYLIASAYKLIGLWEPAARIISYIFSICTIIVFFRLSRFLFNEKTALVVSSFFALSPLLMIISTSIQPESSMFFFYIGAAYAFIRWLDNQSGKYYFATAVFTAFALLTKITAINIGILFVLLITIKKGWRFLLKPKVILLGLLSVLPSVAWYVYSHKFYLLYGNSLGLSNQYAWVSKDIFTKPYIIRSIIEQDLTHVWTYSGPFIIILALVSSKLIRKQYIILPLCWLFAVIVFYIVAARTTSSTSYYYYHLFSIPAASMLLGISVTEIYDKYSPKRYIRNQEADGISDFIRSRLILPVLFVLVAAYIGLSAMYLIRTVPSVYKSSDYYTCTTRLSEMIPGGSMILVSGGICSEGKYLNAYNAPYFFYWLDRKGYNICIEDQSIENVLAFKKKGASFFVAETQFMSRIQGFEAQLRNNFRVLMECNGIVLFEL
jgi:4-amino-4-deoxy-L-arabinose transferase-like glycosyltransferase